VVVIKKGGGRKQSEIEKKNRIGKSIGGRTGSERDCSRRLRACAKRGGGGKKPNKWVAARSGIGEGKSKGSPYPLKDRSHKRDAKREKPA